MSTMQSTRVMRTSFTPVANSGKITGMTKQALQQLLSSIQYNIIQIDADLARLNPTTGDQMYHQGYQTGRKAELESFATTISMALS